MGCLKSIFWLALILALAVVLFLNRDRVQRVWRDLRGPSDVELVATPEMARAADSRLDRLRDGRVSSVALTETEVQALLLYKYRNLLPAFVDSPRIELDGGKIIVHGRVPAERLPQLSELGEAASFLPDTTEISVVGELIPLGRGRIGLGVDQVRAARIPLPKRLVGPALRKLGRKDEPGLPADALAVPLPPGVDAAYVRGDSLVFLNNASSKN